MRIYEKRAALEQFQELKEKKPELAEIIDLHQDLLEAQIRARAIKTNLAFNPDDVKNSIHRGKPLLSTLEVKLDWGAFSQLCQQICHTVVRHQSDLEHQSDEFLALLESDPMSIKPLVHQALIDGRLVAAQDEFNAQRGFQFFVLNHTLRLFLQGYADLLLPMIEQKKWQRSTCPICGGEPDLAYLDGESGSRHLICARCDSPWLFPRVKCPFCNTQDPAQLYYHPFEDGKYRLYACQVCRRYLKALDLRKVGHHTLISVERIATVVMDMVAQDEGYL